MTMNILAVILRRRLRAPLVRGADMNQMLKAEKVADMKETKILADKVQVYYGETHAIKDVDLRIEDKTVTAFIGPSGCGKSTFLRCLNRMNDTIDICRVQGKIEIDGEDIYDPKVDPVQLRAKVGMVFQKPNPFPKSIFEQRGLRATQSHGLAQNKTVLEEIVGLEPAEGGLVGRGQGPSLRTGYRPVGWPAAAPVHCPRHRGQP